MIDPTSARLLAAVDDLIWDQLRVTADRLEECCEIELATAFRWLADKRLAPLRFGDRWHWRKMGESLPLGHVLPNEIRLAMFNLPGEIGVHWNEAPSMSEAYWLAARAIVAADRQAALSEKGKGY